MTSFLWKFQKNFQPIRTKQFLDITLDPKYSFLKNVNQKAFEILRITLQEKRKYSVWFPYWWNRCIFLLFSQFFGLSKGLFRETYSIKEFTFDSHIAYQSYKLTAELHLTRKEILFILENLKLIKKSYDNISKTLFFPYPTPKFVKTPQQSSLFLHFFKDFQSSKSCMIRFGIRFPEICFEKFINFELSSQIYNKIE